MTTFELIVYIIEFFLITIGAYLLFEVSGFFKKTALLIALLILVGWFSLNAFLTVFTW